MKKFLLPILFFLAATSAYAAPSVTIAWQLSTSTAVTSQNVYRAPCIGTITAGVCSTDSTAVFTKLASVSATVTTFTDTTVANGQEYIYYLTAVCPTTGPCQGESIPSNHVAGTIPGVPPPPPTGVSITSVTAQVTGNSQTVVAKWSDPSGTEQYFSFSDGTNFVAQGLTSSLTGNFAEKYTGPASTPVTFTVCDAKGSCATQQVN